MSSDGVAFDGERPLANAGPILVVAAVGLVAVVGLVLSLFRNPGLPAYIEDSYMRVAGGLVSPERAQHDPAALSAELSGVPPGAVRVPSLDAEGYRLEGGTHAVLGGEPAALAIYHNSLRDLVVWHGVEGTLDALPQTPDVRVIGGRKYVVHYKASTAIVCWQEGPILMAITSALPSEHVMRIAVAASSSARP
jgi:hypothetical protein